MPTPVPTATYQFLIGRLVATLSREGGTIPGVVIEVWLAAKRRQFAEDAGDGDEAA